MQVAYRKYKMLFEFDRKYPYHRRYGVYFLYPVSARTAKCNNDEGFYRRQSQFMTILLEINSSIRSRELLEGLPACS